MADEFDWGGTIQAGIDTGAMLGAIVIDTDGNYLASHPLNEAGEMMYNLWGGADYSYTAPVTQEDGSEKEEPVDEIANMVMLGTGKKGSIPRGIGIRIDQKKYMHIRTLESETHSITPAGAEDEVDVTIEAVHILRCGSLGAVVCVKQGYIIVVLHDAGKPEQQFPDAIKAASHIFYWACGADPEE